MLVEREHRHVVARGGVRIDQAEILALQFFDLLVGTVGARIEYRIVSFGAVAVDVDRKRVGRYAGQTCAGERCRTVIAMWMFPERWPSITAA